MPEVKRAAVVGMPDAAAGERVVAAVVPVTGTEPTPDSIAAGIRKDLAAYKMPAEIVILSEGELPVGATQKVSKPRLRELLEARQEGE